MKRVLNFDAFVKLLKSKGVNLLSIYPSPCHNSELQTKDVDHAKLMADSFFIVISDTYPNFTSKEFDKLFGQMAVNGQLGTSSLSMKGIKFKKERLKEFYHKLVEEAFQ
jgi:hypothetical protein